MLALVVVVASELEGRELRGWMWISLPITQSRVDCNPCNPTADTVVLTCTINRGLQSTPQHIDFGTEGIWVPVMTVAVASGTGCLACIAALKDMLTFVES
jgi:hypothetical protein